MFDISWDRSGDDFDTRSSTTSVSPNTRTSESTWAALKRSLFLDGSYFPISSKNKSSNSNLSKPSDTNSKYPVDNHLSASSEKAAKKYRNFITAPKTSSSNDDPWAYYYAYTNAVANANSSFKNKHVANKAYSTAGIVALNDIPSQASNTKNKRAVQAQSNPMSNNTLQKQKRKSNPSSIDNPKKNNSSNKSSSKSGALNPSTSSLASGSAAYSIAPPRERAPTNTPSAKNEPIPASISPTDSIRETLLASMFRKQHDIAQRRSERIGSYSSASSLASTVPSSPATSKTTNDDYSDFYGFDPYDYGRNQSYSSPHVYAQSEYGGEYFIDSSLKHLPPLRNPSHNKKHFKHQRNYSTGSVLTETIDEVEEEVDDGLNEWGLPKILVATKYEDEPDPEELLNQPHYHIENDGANVLKETHQDSGNQQENFGVASLAELYKHEEEVLEDIQHEAELNSVKYEKVAKSYGLDDTLSFQKFGTSSIDGIHEKCEKYSTHKRKSSLSSQSNSHKSRPLEKANRVFSGIKLDFPSKPKSVPRSLQNQDNALSSQDEKKDTSNSTTIIGDVYEKQNTSADQTTDAYTKSSIKTAEILSKNENSDMEEEVEIYVGPKPKSSNTKTDHEIPSASLPPTVPSYRYSIRTLDRFLTLFYIALFFIFTKYITLLKHFLNDYRSLIASNDGKRNKELKEKIATTRYLLHLIHTNLSIYSSILSQTAQSLGASSPNIHTRNIKVFQTIFQIVARVIASSRQLKERKQALKNVQEVKRRKV